MFYFKEKWHLLETLKYYYLTFYRDLPEISKVGFDMWSGSPYCVSSKFNLIKEIGGTKLF